VPLSDEEARLLQQMEQSLAQDDPEFASTLRGSKYRAHNRRVAIISATVFTLGIAMLLTGAVLALTVVGVAGFVAMIAGSYFFITSWRNGFRDAGKEDAARPSPKKPSGSFVDRMEERWNRRQHGDGR